MDQTLIIVLIIANIVILGAALAGGYYMGNRMGRARLLTEQEEAGANRRKLAEEEAARLVSEADKRGQQLEIQGRDKAERITNEAEEVVKKRRVELDKEVERLDRRREEFDKRIERLDLRERELNKRQSRMDKQKQDFDKMLEERKAELERVAQMTSRRGSRRTALRCRNRSARRHGPQNARGGRRSQRRVRTPRPRCDLACYSAARLRSGQRVDRQRGCVALR